MILEVWLYETCYDVVCCVITVRVAKGDTYDILCVICFIICYIYMTCVMLYVMC